MDNKYYTPNIEEFHIGFEYEVFQSSTKESMKYSAKQDVWIDIIHNVSLTLLSVKEILRDDLVRVKYLDKEDVAELDWKITKEYSCEFEAQYKVSEYEFYDLTYEQEEHRLTIEKFYQSKMIAKPINQYDSVTVFIGIIKNKSELKRIIKQLNIN